MEYNIDYIFIIAAWLLGSLSLFSSYYFGGAYWRDKFRIKWQDSSGQDKQYEGYWAEFTIWTAATIFIVVISKLALDISILNTLEVHRIWLGILLSLIIIFYIAHILNEIKLQRDLGELDKGPKDFRPGKVRTRSLKVGYTVYSIYSITLFFWFALMGVLFILQISNDASAVNSTLISAGKYVEQAKSAQNTPEVQSLVEQAYGQIHIGLSLLAKRIDIIFWFLAVVLVLNFLMTFAFRQAYAPNAITYTHITTGIILSLIIGCAIYYYSTSYGPFMKTLFADLNALRSGLKTDDWELLQRYNEITIDLNRRKELTGFISTMTSEPGVSASLVALVAWGANLVSFIKAR